MGSRGGDRRPFFLVVQRDFLEERRCWLCTLSWPDLSFFLHPYGLLGGKPFGPGLPFLALSGLLSISQLYRECSEQKHFQVGRPIARVLQIGSGLCARVNVAQEEAQHRGWSAHAAMLPQRYDGQPTPLETGQPPHPSLAPARCSQAQKERLAARHRCCDCHWQCAHSHRVAALQGVW